MIDSETIIMKGKRCADWLSFGADLYGKNTACLQRMKFKVNPAPTEMISFSGRR